MYKNLTLNFIDLHKELNFDANGVISYYVDELDDNWKNNTYQRSLQIYRETLELIKNMEYVSISLNFQLITHNFVYSRDLVDLIECKIDGIFLDNIEYHTPPEIVIITKKQNYRLQSKWFFRRILDKSKLRLSEGENGFYILTFDEHHNEFSQQVDIVKEQHL